MRCVVSNERNQVIALFNLKCFSGRRGGGWDGATEMEEIKSPLRSRGDVVVVQGTYITTPALASTSNPTGDFFSPSS